MKNLAVVIIWEELLIGEVSPSTPLAFLDPTPAGRPQSAVPPPGACHFELAPERHSIKIFLKNAL